MKSKTITLIIILCFILTYSPSPAYAGQLFTEYYGILKVIEMTGIAILGSVISINAKDKKVTLLVKKIWNIKMDNPTVRVNTQRVDEEGETYTSVENVPVEIGKKIELNVYTGVEWTDPGKSPIDNRLFGHLDFGQIKAGQEIIAAGFELLPANKEIMGRLDRIFSANFKSDYPKKAKKEDLISDLNDYDLAKMAFTELLDRKEASLKTIMSLQDTEICLTLLTLLFEKTKDSAGKTLFSEAKTEFLANYPMPLKNSILYHLVSQAKPDMMTAASEFIVHLLYSKQTNIEKDEETHFLNSVLDRGNELLRKIDSKFSPSNVDSLGQLYWSLKLMQTTNPDAEILERETKNLLKDNSKDIQTEFVSSGFKALAKFKNFKNGESSERAHLINKVLENLKF